MKTRLWLGLEERDPGRGRERRRDTRARHAGADDDKIEGVRSSPDDSPLHAVPKDRRRIIPDTFVGHGARGGL